MVAGVGDEWGGPQPRSELDVDERLPDTGAEDDQQDRDGGVDRGPHTRWQFEQPAHPCSQSAEQVAGGDEHEQQGHPDL